MSQDEGIRRRGHTLAGLRPHDVHEANQKRRIMAGEFLIRTKGHLDRLAQAGLDTRIVRELVALHTLAAMGCAGMDRRSVDSDEVMELVNCASYFEALDLPTTANEAAMFAKRVAVASVGGTDEREALYQAGYSDAVQDTVQAITALGAAKEA